MFHAALASSAAMEVLPLLAKVHGCTAGVLASGIPCTAKFITDKAAALNQREWALFTKRFRCFTAAAIF